MVGARSAFARWVIPGVCLVLASLTWSADTSAAQTEEGTGLPAVTRPGTAQWHLRSTLTSGPADRSFVYGVPGDLTVMGDWDADGIATPGVVRGDRWFLRNDNSPGAADVVFTFAGAEDAIPVVGDWDGDGTDTAGYVDNSEVHRCVTGADFGYCGPAGSVWTLRQTNAPTSSTETVDYNQGGTPVVGDWDGDGIDDIGVVAEAYWFLLIGDRSSGQSDHRFRYGTSGDIPLAGDWDRDGVDEPAVVRGNRWLARRDPAPGPAQLAFHFGRPSDVPRSWSQ